MSAHTARSSSCICANTHPRDGESQTLHVSELLGRDSEKAGLLVLHAAGRRHVRSVRIRGQVDESGTSVRDAGRLGEDLFTAVGD